MANSRPEHNIPSGPIEACQICGNRQLQLVLDLGHQPLCDTLLTAEELASPELTFPLQQLWCPECSLSQLSYCVPGDIVYHKEYPYRTGVTRELAAYQTELAGSLVEDLQLASDALVVDIGCNDGTLLQAFRTRGVQVAGVEPTRIARFAREAGIEVVESPFDPDVAQQVVDSRGRAQLVTATNVFAHMASLGDFLRGLEILVADDGHFVLENHYLGAVMERMQFDTIYHEHLRTYSLTALVRLFDYYDFTVVDALKVSRYGGNIRVTVARSKQAQVSPRVQQLLDEEQSWVWDAEYYASFRRRSIQLKNQLVELALTCAAQGTPLVGNSCPGRASTLLNFAGIGPDLMPYIAEQSTSLKLGMYLPGRHIPVVDSKRLIDEQPAHVLLLAWHYAQPIAEQLRARGLRSKLYSPLPEVAELSI